MTKLLVFALLCFSFSQLSPVLWYRGSVHEEAGMPLIHLFGDIHLERSKDYNLWHKADAQTLAICSYFQKYKGEKPLHILIEGATERMPLLGMVYLMCVSYLYDKLKPLSQNTVHIVEDFDIRKIIGYVLSVLYQPKKDYSYNSRYFSYPQEARDLNFQALWNEIEIYLYTISHACTNYFGEKFVSSKTAYYLLKARKLYEEMREICHNYSISSTDTIFEVAKQITIEPLFYSETEDLREYLLNSLMSIGCYLTDTALALKVMQAHKQNKRVFVFAGVSHIRKLKKQLESFGYCGQLHRGEVDDSDIRTHLDSDDIGCVHESSNREDNKCPFKREFPELPPYKYPSPFEKSPSTQCAIF